MNARHSIERAEVSINGVRSPIVRAGDAQSREAVVFVHGNPGSANDWLDLIEHVAPRRLLDDSGHWPMIDNPAATRDAVLPFLKRQLLAVQESPNP